MIDCFQILKMIFGGLNYFWLELLTGAEITALDASRNVELNEIRLKAKKLEGPI